MGVTWVGPNVPGIPGSARIEAPATRQGTVELRARGPGARQSMRRSAASRCRLVVSPWLARAGVCRRGTRAKNQLANKAVLRYAITVSVRQAGLVKTGGSRNRGDISPERIGPWRLEGEIGRGGMGVVAWARHVEDGRVAAVKRVHGHLVADEEARARFRREVALLQQIEASCVARVLDAEVDSDEPYVATEFVAGLSLDHYVHKHGPLSLDALMAFAAGLADGLAHVHAAGVIHRDLTAGNVLLAVDGPKIVDFGIATAVDDTRMTASRQIVGTPRWMAPEQVRGEAPTPACDIFAWGGAVAYAATGTAPFGTDTPDAVLYRIVHEPPQMEGLDPSVGDLVAAALAKDASARPPARSLADQLLARLDEPAVDAALTRTWPAVPATEAAPTLAASATNRSRGRRTRVTFLIVAAVLAVAAPVGWGLGDLDWRLLTDRSSKNDEPDASTGEGVTSAPTEEDSASPESPEPTSEPAPSPEPGPEDDIPRLSTHVEPGTMQANELFDFLADNVGGIVYIDVTIEDRDLFVQEDDEPANLTVPTAGDMVGAEYLISDLGNETDSFFFWNRGNWELTGYFAVRSISQAHQGVISISLRAVPINAVGD